MKIMQFMPEFGLAGAETMCENLVYELLSRGHEVCVASFYDYHSPITQRLEKVGVSLIYLNKKFGFDWRVIPRIREAIKKFQPEIIHTHLYILKYIVAATIGLHIKGIVHTVHNIAQKENSFADRFVNRFFFLKKNIVPVALSNEIRKTIQEVYRLPIENIPIIFNGVPLQTKYKKTNYSNEHKIKIINIGRYTEVKNQLTLIEAINKLHNADSRVELDIYGDGPLKDKINQRIIELGAGEYIRENGLTDDVNAKLQNADIFILPSIYEGMPMTIIEAMAMGVPVIASKVGGIPDMINDGDNGLLCKPNVNSIMSSITRLIEDDKLRSDISKSALEKVERFSSEQMATLYIELYSSIICR